MRRTLLRLALGDLGRVVADLIKTHRETGDADLADRVSGFLTRLGAASTYWPGDDELRSGLLTEPAYRRFKRGRLRMFLEAVEDHCRGYTGATASRTGMRVPRLDFPIEHLLPQKWSAHWPVDNLAAEVERDAHVHRLGNLTLITSSLNSAVSNGPWLGEKGKRAQLEKHDVLLMNRRVRDMSAAGWDEGRIDDRTGELVEALIATWPVPEGHVGGIAEPSSSQPVEVSLKELVAAGLLTAGTTLRARPGEWGDVRCEVLPSGDLLLDGQQYSSPSGAAHRVRKGAANGWFFWRLEDGRRLADLRSAFQAQA